MGNATLLANSSVKRNSRMRYLMGSRANRAPNMRTILILEHVEESPDLTGVPLQ